MTAVDWIRLAEIAEECSNAAASRPRDISPEKMLLEFAAALRKEAEAARGPSPHAGWIRLAEIAESCMAVVHDQGRPVGVIDGAAFVAALRKEALIAVNSPPARCPPGGHMTRLVLLLALGCDTSDLTAERQDAYGRRLEACFEKANNAEGGYSEEVLWRCLCEKVQSVDGGTD